MRSIRSADMAPGNMQACKMQCLMAKKWQKQLQENSMKRFLMLSTIFMNLQSFQDDKSFLNERMQMNKFYQGKKVLVTGGCGFIGSHLAEKLVALGAHVTIIDDLS